MPIDSLNPDLPPIQKFSVDQLSSALKPFGEALAPIFYPLHEKMKSFRDRDQLEQLTERERNKFKILALSLSHMRDHQQISLERLSEVLTEQEREQFLTHLLQSPQVKEILSVYQEDLQTHFSLVKYKNIIPSEFLPKESEKDFSKERLEQLDNTFLEAIEKLLKDGVNEEKVALGLAGLDSPRTWEIRARLRDNGVRDTFIIQGLAGLDSPQAWEMREQFLGDASTINAVIIKSLAGLDSPRAWEIREQFLNADKDSSQVYKNCIAISLAGLDSERAWEMRELFMSKRMLARRRLMNADPQEEMYKGFIAEGLAGLDSPRAWDMRERILVELGDYFSKDTFIRGLVGLDSPRAWEIREQFLNADKDSSQVYKNCIAISLAGLDSDRAWDMRERLMNKGAHKGCIAQSLAGLDSDRAWKMRERFMSNENERIDYVNRSPFYEENDELYDEARRAAQEDYLENGEASKGDVALGLAGDSTTFVWRLKF